MIIPLSQVDIAPQHLSVVTAILRRYLPDREVWAYGSRVSGHSWRYSDLDLVVLGDQPLSATLIEDLLDDLSETLVPYIMDLKDWNHIPQHWQDEIRRCYAIIYSPDRPPELNPGPQNDLDPTNSGVQIWALRPEDVM